MRACPHRPTTAATTGTTSTNLASGVIQLPKTGERCADDPKCHNRWHSAIPPVENANSGDVVVFGTRDAFDHSLDRNSTRPTSLR